MDKKLNIAFVWHMHQPLYKDPFTDEYILPWVLLHATKDYYDMAAILDEFPDVHQTFNLVPSLIEQLRDYESFDVRDKTRALSSRPASELTHDERRQILETFFQANWHGMIKPYPKYYELLTKRGFTCDARDIDSAARFFSEQEFLDLQTLFNLAWIDPKTLGDDPELARLREKGSGFSEEDKAVVLAKQIEITRRVIPKYKELAEKGIIELTTSPYYHPILPLLCDSDSAKEALPDIALPKKRFSHPEDAAIQLDKALKLHKETFGTLPAGLWPSEGSVSMDILPLLKERGISWIATDEEILARSVDQLIGRDEAGLPDDTILYRPYSLHDDKGEIKVIFRDHKFSDLIGFEYARWDPEEAASDLINKLSAIRERTDDPERHLVSIILDGENAWETYSNDGRDFLCALYGKLSESQTLRCVTVSEFLEGSDTDPLERIFAGSWINHNFRVWIGHVEDNTAWNYIEEARSALVSAEEAKEIAAEDIKKAWELIYAAEGSDWFWWYGDDHSSENDAVFDQLFRRNLKKLYELIGEEHPLSLDIPIISTERGLRAEELPARLLEPKIDGEITNYFEWLGSGLIDRSLGGGASGAMHTDVRFDGVVEKIAFGFDLDNLFFRLDYIDEISPYEEEWNFTINFLHPKPLKIKATVKGSIANATLHEREEGGKNGNGWREVSELESVTALDVVELKIPFANLQANPGDELWLFINIDGFERGLERWPVKGFIIIDLPTKDFGKDDWTV